MTERMNAQIFKWPRHKLFRCDSRECMGCQFCEGGLAFCTVCKGAEATLPTDCPGTPIAEWDSVLIQNGLLDYNRKLGWICTGEPSPTATM
jgi:hypothetical protein